MSDEKQLGISISQQCNLIKEVVGDICSQEKGICIVAENVDEERLQGFNNVIGPKVFIVFVGAEPMGGDDVKELIGRERRFFDILIQRGKILCDPLTTSLTQTTQQAKPFYDLLEIIRDTVRSMIWPSPMVQNPTEYNGMRPFQTDARVLDSYIINISTIVDIGRIQVEAPQLGYGPMVQLQDPEGIVFNKSL